MSERPNFLKRRISINPCKACKAKLNGNIDINELNKCIVDTSGAFSEFDSNASIRGTILDTNWQNCISNEMLKLPNKAGEKRSFCNLQLNMSPVFVNSPHFFPNSLINVLNNDKLVDSNRYTRRTSVAKQKALDMCKKQCNTVKNKLECIDNCITDYNSVTIDDSSAVNRNDLIPCNRVVDNNCIADSSDPLSDKDNTSTSSVSGTKFRADLRSANSDKYTTNLEASKLFFKNTPNWYWVSITIICLLILSLSYIMFRQFRNLSRGTARMRR